MEKLCGNDFILEESHDLQEFNQGLNARFNQDNVINLEKYSQSIRTIQPQRLTNDQPFQFSNSHDTN
jgi:hypothetical protein